MSDSAGDPHVRFSLGLYLLGALGPEERAATRRHLDACHECRAESDEFGEVVVALALLSEEEGRELVEEFGVPLPAYASTRSGDRRSAPAASTVPVHRSLIKASGVPTRSAGPRSAPAARPRRRRARTRGLLGVAGLIVVLLVSAGVFVQLTLRGPTGAPSTPVDVTLAATASDVTTGAAVSVVVSGHDGSVTVRATVTGLHAGTRYELYAITSDAATRVVTRWVGADTPQDVAGDLPVSIDELSFFTVTRSGGTPVVSAYPNRSTPYRSTPPAPR